MATSHLLLARGPLVPGHLLIAARDHRPTFMGGDDPALADLDAMGRLAARAMDAVFGRPVLTFEHGSSRPSATADSHRGHAHVNVLPDLLGPGGLERIEHGLHRAGLSTGRLEAGELIEWYRHGRREEYFTCGTGAGHLVVDVEASAPPPRMFRRRLAELLGLDATTAVEWERDPVPPWDRPEVAGLVRATSAASNLTTLGSAS